MSLRSTRPTAAADDQRGERGGNPHVSSASRFCDDVWDFSDENRNPAVGRHDKRICWSFKLPGGAFTDPPFRSLLTSSKQFIYALRWHPIDTPAHAPASLRNLFRTLKGFIAHLVGYPSPVLRFKDVLPHHCEDYIQKLLSSDASRVRKYRHVQILQMLFQYRNVMQDGFTIDPLKGDSASRIAGKTAGSSGRKTEIIPEEVLGLLVRASLQYVDQFSGYLLGLSDGVEKIRGRASPGQYLNLGTRYLRRHAPAPYPLTGAGLETAVRSLRQLNAELSYLQTACFVLIAFATGMRLSELLSLGEGCCQTETAPEATGLGLVA